MDGTLESQFVGQSGSAERQTVFARGHRQPAAGIRGAERTDSTGRQLTETHAGPGGELAVRPICSIWTWRTEFHESPRIVRRGRRALRTIYRRQTQGVFDVEIVAGPERPWPRSPRRRLCRDRVRPGDARHGWSGTGPEGSANRSASDSDHSLGPCGLATRTHRADGLLFCVLDKPCPRDRLLATLEEAVALASRAVVGMPSP